MGKELIIFILIIMSLMLTGSVLAVINPGTCTCPKPDCTVCGDLSKYPKDTNACNTPEYIPACLKNGVTWCTEKCAVPNKLGCHCCGVVNSPCDSVGDCCANVPVCSNNHCCPSGQSWDGSKCTTGGFATCDQDPNPDAFCNFQTTGAKPHCCGTSPGFCAECCGDSDCGTCQKCSSSNTCVDQTSSEDLKNECAQGTWSCVGGTSPNVCARQRNSGNCDGSGSCSVNDEKAAVGGNQVCAGSGDNSKVDPTSSTYCSTSNVQEECDAGECSANYKEYAHGCTINGCNLNTGTCDCTTGTNGVLIVETVKAEKGYSLTDTCGRTGTVPCNSAWAASPGPGAGNYSKGGKFLCQGMCNGAGTCNYAANCYCASPNYYNNCDSTNDCGETRITTPYNSCDLTSDTGCLTETICNDGYDNNCNNEWDYDTQNRGGQGPSPHGDQNCAVSITGPPTVNNTSPCPSTTITVNCSTSVPNINSVNAFLNGVACTFTSWTSNNNNWLDNKATFICNVQVSGAQTVLCAINNSKSYQTGTNTSLQITAGGCPACSVPEIGALCFDNYDNDCDGLIDGRDPTTCKEGEGVLTNITNRGCADSVDNDANTFIDTNDPGCCDLCTGTSPTTGQTMMWDSTASSQNYMGTPCGKPFNSWQSINSQKEYCCGNNPNEFYKNNTQNNNIVACCNQSTECVDLNGDCQSGKEEIFPLCTDGVDNDCNGLTDIQDPKCGGTLTGYILDENKNPIAGATVKGSPPGVGTEFESVSAPTGPDGMYIISKALVGNYTFIARKAGYDDQVIFIAITSQGTSKQNFTLKNGSCHSDCTDSYGNCNLACNGTNFGVDSCTFISNLCNNRPKDFKVTEAYTSPEGNKMTREYTCCEGPTKDYTEIKAQVTGNAQNLYDYPIQVKLGGKYVTLHITVWENKE